jgi:glucosamine--fructose-6-phosphate aminotransferase (isomerizing)
MSAEMPLSRLFTEAAQAPAVVRAQLVANQIRCTQLGERLRAAPPRALVTCARGSSDHAATFARYLIETRLGVLTSSAAPSVSSVYHASPALAGSVVLAISQSGASPDLLAMVRGARAAGAYIVALVNAPHSALAELADALMPLAAGEERSIAATKSFIASLSAILQMTAAWSQDEALAEVLAQLPQQLERAWMLDWSEAARCLQQASSLYVIGRGPGLAIAQEAALKLKETCGLHAEAISAAEVKHGPLALVRPGFPVLVFTQDDESRAGVVELAGQLAAQGARVLIAGAQAAGAITLPTLSGDALIEPLLLIQSFYRMLSSLAYARGHDPDHPPHLRKITETV